MNVTTVQTLGMASLRLDIFPECKRFPAGSGKYTRPVRFKTEALLPLPDSRGEWGACWFSHSDDDDGRTAACLSMA